MLSAVAFRVWGVMLCLAAGANAADQWVRESTPHFELYTSAGEKKGREALLYFEQVRTFFLQSSPNKVAPEFPARLIAFKSDKQFEPYKLSEVAAAYHVRSDQRDYIVMKSISSEYYPVAIHEYVHLLVADGGLKLPLWMNEGMADVYSTMRPLGNKVLVGDLSRGRVQELMNTKWLNLATLTSVEHESPYYNEKNKAGIFYAQSWLLMHMLLLGQEYRPKYLDFSKAILAGQPASAAFESAYGKSLAQVEKDLQAYLRSNHLQGALFDVKLEKSDLEPEVVDVPPVDAELMLADLLVTLNHKAEASVTLERLARDNPDRPEVEESLGYLAWYGHDREAAQAHFEKAVKLGTKNARMCYLLARLQAGSRTTPKVVVGTLQRALELQPIYREAQLMLGYQALQAQQYAVAMRAFNLIKNVKPEEAYQFFYARAFVYWRLDSKEQARKEAEQARKYAQNPGDQEQADRFLRSLDNKVSATAAPQVTSTSLPGDPVEEPVQPRLRRSTPEESAVTIKNPNRNPFVPAGEETKKVKVKIVSLECLGKSARLHAKSAEGGQPMIFAIPDPGKVLLSNTQEMTFQFQCGPAPKPMTVTVEYGGTAKNGEAGIVRGLELEP